MSGVERKRGREEEEEIISINDDVGGEAKRFHGLTAEGEELLHLLEDIDSAEKNLEVFDQDSDEATEDLVNGVMRSLEEEIGFNNNNASCSSSNGKTVAEDRLLSESTTSLEDIDSGTSHLREEPNSCLLMESRVDLGYLLEASDDELGIPPTRMTVQDEVSSDESCADLLESPAAVQNGCYDGFWHFEDEVVNYNMLEFGYPCDVNRIHETHEGREFVNSCVLFEHFDAENSLAWRHEAACGL